MLPFALLLAAIWGVIWALILQFTKLGAFLATRRTWFSVVVGVGGDLLIALIITPFDIWWNIVLIVLLSSLGIIYRSLQNELSDQLRAIDIVQNETGQQDDLGD